MGASTHPTPTEDATDAVTDSTDAARSSLRRVRGVAHLMDEAFRVPGTDVRFGIDPVVGILPIAGSGVAALFSLYVVLEAARADVPRTTLVLMLALLGVDAVIGSVPLFGPLFDVVWKANTWNVRTLERHVER